jgi:hypothetical protein
LNTALGEGVGDVYDIDAQALKTGYCRLALHDRDYKEGFTVTVTAPIGNLTDVRFEIDAPSSLSLEEFKDLVALIYNGHMVFGVIQAIVGSFL